MNEQLSSSSIIHFSNMFTNKKVIRKIICVLNLIQYFLVSVKSSRWQWNSMGMLTKIDEYSYPYFHRKFASYGTVNGSYFFVVSGTEIRCRVRYRIFNVYGRKGAVASLCAAHISVPDITDWMRSVYVS
jgi:hypothetical protein